MHQWIWQALSQAAWLNPDITLVALHQAHVAVSHATKTPISNSMTGRQFYFGLQGCSPGRQHYRYCTPHALRTLADLLCPFCKGGTRTWLEQRRSNIPYSEASIMCMLAILHMDTSLCWQVMVGFWAAPVDFKCMHHSVIIQADGSCHFKRMYDSTTGKHLDDDLRLCAAAYSAGYSVVRVHDLQLANMRNPAFLAAAVSTAASTRCVVLSPGYASVCMYDQGGFVTYAAMLCERLPGCSVSRDSFNNLVICCV